MLDLLWGWPPYSILRSPSYLRSLCRWKILGWKQSKVSPEKFRPTTFVSYCWLFNQFAVLQRYSHHHHQSRWSLHFVLKRLGDRCTCHLVLFANRTFSLVCLACSLDLHNNLRRGSKPTTRADISNAPQFMGSVRFCSRRATVDKKSKIKLD